MDLTLKFCNYFCLHYQCFYVSFLGHTWTLHLSFVPIFVYIINVFLLVFWVIYALTLMFCTYFCLHYQCFYVCFLGHICTYT
jgi:hypothetical protein